MKGTIGILGFVALAAMIGFSLAGCKNPSGGGSDPALAGTVSISGNALVGQTLTAVTTGLEGSGTISYQWKRVAAGGSEANVGTNSDTYEVQAADVGATIAVTVTRAGYSGSKTSEPTATVTDPNAPPLTGTVSIGGNALVGQVLTANTAALGGSGTISYQWKRGTANVGTNSSTYTVQDADIGFAITVTVTRIGNSGSITSEPTATVTDPNAPPLTGTVGISGNAIVGQTLTANTTALGGTGTISYQWKRGTTSIGTGSTYAVVAADVGFTITVTVTRSGNSGSRESTATAAVIFPAITGTVSIDGTAEVGQILTANTAALGGTGTISYQWKRGTTNVGTDSTYTVQAADVGSTIKVAVTRSGNSGAVESDATATVPAEPGTLNISISAEGDASISGSAIIVDGVLTLTRSSAAVTITLANAGTYDSGSIRWRVQNTAITGSGASFVLDASSPAYAAGKQYFVTVDASRNGVPFDFTFTFVVEG